MKATKGRAPVAHALLAVVLLLVLAPARGQTPDAEPADERRPEFADPQEGGGAALVVASQWDSEVFLPCKILNLDSGQTVSWIRERDSLVLTIDKLKLIDEPRFALAKGPDDWTLAIGQPTSRDAGLYECQVSSMEPKLSQLVELKLVEASSSIQANGSLATLRLPVVGPSKQQQQHPSVYLRKGDTLRLSCSIEAPRRTDFVYWYRNKDSIFFHDLRATGAATKLDPPEGHQLVAARNGPSFVGRRVPANDGLVKTSSSLVVASVQPHDSANYTCLPSNARPSHINVLVLQDNGAQLQPEKRSLQASDSARKPADSRGQEVIIAALSLAASFYLFTLDRG